MEQNEIYGNILSPRLNFECLSTFVSDSTLHIIFNDVLDNAFVGFVSKGELVLVEYFMGDATRGGRLRWNGRSGWGEELEGFRLSGWRRRGSYPTNSTLSTCIPGDNVVESAKIIINELKCLKRELKSNKNFINVA